MTAAAPAPRARTYGQYCPIAVGLDLLGDRWTLLVCRELLRGDQRFTDLRAALPGMAPNLLTDRLRALAAGGLIESIELPPPVARNVYRLTDEGRDITPVLRAVARFGAKYLDPDDAELIDVERSARALLIAWRRSGDVTFRARLTFGADTVDERSVDLEITPDDTVVTEPGAPAPDLIVATTPAALVRARQGEPFVGVFTGPTTWRREFLAAFRLT